MNSLELGSNRNYELIEMVGRGGNATVYRSKLSKDAPDIAIKIFDAKVTEPLYTKRSIEKAAIQEGIDPHPNIIRFLGYGEGHIETIDDTGKRLLTHEYPILATEFAEGGTVSDLLYSQGPLSPQRAFTLIQEAANGLRHMHETGVLHLDIKPDNLYLSRFGTLQIGDFDTAQLLSTAHIPQQVFAFTASFTAPERLRTRTATPVSDEYSLAAVAYTLLTGKKPFNRKDATSAEETSPPPFEKLLNRKMNHVYEAMETSIIKGLSEKPEDRHGGIEAFIDDLQTVFAKASGKHQSLLADVLPSTRIYRAAKESARNGGYRPEETQMKNTVLFVAPEMLLKKKYIDRPNRQGSKLIIDRIPALD